MSVRFWQTSFASWSPKTRGTRRLRSERWRCSLLHYRSVARLCLAVSFMNDVVFVDTNILVYAYDVVSAYGAWVREPMSAETVLRATDSADLAQISFRDALIVAAAEQVGAAQLLSEDLNDGQEIAGIKVTNPLVVA